MVLLQHWKGVQWHSGLVLGPAFRLTKMPPPGVILDIIEHRRRVEGAGSLKNPVKFHRQDFHTLRQYCLDNRLRFTDGSFPPDSSSIGPGVLKDHDLARVVWKRPWKIVQNPCLIVQGVSRFDFMQGKVGDCWFLASIGAMTFQKRILEQVLPTDQGFGNDYAGIFHFRFWRFGKWVDVVIDDKLPTLDGKLIFVHPNRDNEVEYWAPLLEKAYAKVCGSYADVIAGSVSEGLMDFVGEAYVGFILKPALSYLWDLMDRAKKYVSLMGCATLAVTPGEDTELPNGLVAGHAYAVTGVAQVISHGHPVKLVRVWNPWGFTEWKNDWSDKSPLWQTVSEENRRKCLKDADNGEFWMSMQDFLENFCELHICSLSPDYLDDSECCWTSSTQEETFWTNPQYLVTVENETQHTEDQGTANMLVSVIQKSDKKHRHLATMYQIGFYVFEFQNSKQRFPASFFNTHKPVEQTKTLISARGVPKFFWLRPGQYIIVPSTKNPNEASGFLLKIFSKFKVFVELTKMPPPGVILNIIEHRRRAEGEGSIENPVKFHGQDFHTLRQYCLRNRLRFTDGTFPPDSSSIGPGIMEDHDLARVVWRRPWEVVKNPHLIVDGVSRFDFGQGRLGDCWFLASIGAMTFQKRILEQVLPTDQGFGNDYAGIFHFRFWRFGKWVDVVVDDKLPTINNTFIFVHPKTAGEFWAALLEKAYAKVCGSYSDMAIGYLSEAMLDFTGGVYVGFNLRRPPPDLWDIMHRAVKHISLLGCLTPQGQKSGNAVLPNGLVTGHAYAVTGVTQVISYGQPVRLVRVWNPWGQAEWTGDWSDRSSLWQSVSLEDRARCLQIADNGEFWISLDSFLKNFCILEICCLSPNFLDDSKCRWASSFHDGRWVAGVTAETFWTNPQYLVTVTATGPQYTEHHGLRNTLVTLIQKSDKTHRHLSPNYGIDFYIYVFQNHRQKFPSSFFYGHNPVAKAESFPVAREMTAYFQLKPGKYIIVPSTKHPNEASSFVLKIFSKLYILAEFQFCHHLGAQIPAAPEDGNSAKKKYMEVNAEQLQMLLNEKVIKGFTVSDGLLNLIALRYSSSSGELSLESFIFLLLRLDCMDTEEVVSTGSTRSVV
ncbi:calpain-1 catalytic subunit-like, partial [Scleropages formosus]